MRTALLTLTIAAGTLTATGSVLAQNAPWPAAPAAVRAVFNRFAGIYRLVDGGRGYLAYDASGYMGISMHQPDRPRRSSGPLTSDDVRAAMDSYSAYFGSFAVDEAAGTVTHETLGALHPRISGTDIVQTFSLAGNRLTLRPLASGGASRAQVWERLPDLPALRPLHRQLIGLWKLVSTERRNMKGELVRSYPGWTGFIFYAASGHMLVHMTEPYRRRPVGNVPTPAEVMAAYQNYTSYFGTYTFESSGSLIHHVEGSVVPGAAGTDTQRFFEFSGKQLILRPPAIKTPEGDVIMTNVWERME